MTTAMHGRADTSTHDADESDRVIDLSAPTLYGPRADAGTNSTPDQVHQASTAPTQAAPTPVEPTQSRPAPLDADALARMAADVAVSVERHRQELAAAMAELTSLQRILRSEVRSVIAELDRIAEGVAPATVDTPEQSVAAQDSVDPGRSGASRRTITSRLRRAH